MAIQLGDAIMNFIADSTQLDAAIAKVNSETGSKLKPVGTAIRDGVQKPLDDAAGSADNAGKNSRKFGDEADKAGKRAKESFGEAKGTIALMGEELGVKVPRHIRSFITAIPGLGSVLNAAFSATALFVFLQVLSEIPEAIDKIVGKIAHWTEEEKKAYDEMLSLNRQILQFNEDLAVKQRHLTEIGLEGSQKQSQALANYKGDLDQVNEKIKTTGTNLAEMHKQLEGTRTYTVTRRDKEGNEWQDVHQVSLAANLSKDEIERLKKSIADTTEEMSKLIGKKAELEKVTITGAEKELGKQELDELVATGKAKLSADRSVAEARANLAKAHAELLLAQGKTSSTQEIAQEKETDEHLYRNKVASMERERALLEKDPFKNRDAIKQLNGEIEVLEIQHDTTIVRNKAASIAKLAELNKYLRSDLFLADSLETNDAFDKLPIKLTAAQKAVVDLTQAEHDAGVETATTWGEKEAIIEEAIDRMRQYGATQAELMAGELHLLEIRKLSAEAGNEMFSDADQARLDELRRTLMDIANATSGVYKWNASLFDLWKTKLPTSAQVWKHVKDEMKSATVDLQHAEEGAIQSWILGQDSLGKALRKATATVLAEYAARAAVQAIYYTALGFARLAEYDFEGASNAFTAAAELGVFAGVAGGMAAAINPSDKSSSASSSDTGSPSASGAPAATQAAATNPIPVTNVTRFATGGLITRPTMAILGDSVNGGSTKKGEGAIPLDDDRAMDAIAGEIASRMPASGNHFHIAGLISPDNLDKVIDNINGRVANGKRLTASHARRVESK